MSGVIEQEQQSLLSCRKRMVSLSLAEFGSGFDSGSACDAGDSKINVVKSKKIARAFFNG